MVLNKRYYERIMTEMWKNDLVKQVISNVNEIDFDFPQLQQSTGHFFCNEQVYGEYNLLIITGFMYVGLREDDIFVLNELPQILYECLNLPMEVCNIMIAFLPVQP